MSVRVSFRRGRKDPSNSQYGSGTYGGRKIKNDSWVIGGISKKEKRVKTGGEQE